MVCLNPSLLIIENSVTNFTRYQNYLGATSCGDNLSLAASIAEGLDLCRTSTIDTVLLGGSISDVDGLAFLESLAGQDGVVGGAAPRENRPTVIMVATEGDPRIAVRAMKLGAQDYLLERDLTPELLHSAIESGMEKSRLQLQLNNGRAVWMSGTSEDITAPKCAQIERQQAEASLQKLSAELERQLQRFDAMASSVSDFIYTFDLSGRFTYINQPLLDLWQLSLDSAIGKNFHELNYPPELAESLQAQIQQVIATQQPIKDETPYTSFQGTGTYEYIFGPLFAKDGAMEGVAGITRDITNRKQAQLTLQASEQRYKALIDITTQIVWNADADGTILNSNSGTFTGQSQEDYQGWGWMEAIHPDDRQRTSEVWLLAVANLTPYQIEHRLRRYDGEYRLMSGRAVPLLDADGNVREWVGLHTDITEVRQAEDELRQAQALAQSQLAEIEAIYQTAPIGLTILDGDLRYQRINQQLAEINGITIADHIGRTVREIIPDLADEAEPLFRRVLETGEPVLNLEISGETNSQPGINRTWLQNYYPLKDGTGQSIGINAVVQEISDRKQAELALKESEERFRSTFEQAAVGIAHVALDGRWLLFNPKLCEIFGYTPAELLNGYFQDITHPDDLAQDRESIRQILADEIQSIELDKRYIHQLGHIVWVNLTGTLRRDPSGAPLYFIASIEDISHRKHAELALQAQAAKLAETTALIELRNQELNRFTHTVSHDLKAPLRGISNLAAWIRDDLPPTIDPDILANLELMRSRVARMDSLIDGLLEYARVGSTTASLTTFRVEQLLAEIVDSLSIPDSFVVELPAELPPITTNRVLLGQVLANLIGNAYKHHDRSDGRIQVTVQPDDQSWRFSVTDDGCGIAPENQERVFDIFKTLSGADKNNTGIGLSIVKKLVETHGGKITLESQIGVGTTFCFTW